MSITPAEFLASAPKSLSGSSPWSVRYAGEIKRIWLEHAANDSRTLQKHLGPSELGVECHKQVVGKLIGMPTTNHVVDPWPSIRGKAMHAHAEDVFKGDNERRGQRWVTEKRVTPFLEAFGLVGFLEHPGTADLYDAAEQAVVDHKFLGESSMAKIRKEPPRKYIVQLLLYGLGYLYLGLPVKRVAVLAYPATAGSLDGLYVWDKEVTSDGYTLLPDVVDLLTTVQDETAVRKAMAAMVQARQLRFADIPTAPDDSECYFCFAYRPQAVDGQAGCPGPRGRAS